MGLRVSDVVGIRTSEVFGLPIPDASAETATRVDIASFAFTNYGPHVAFQENGLSARKAAPSLGYDLVQQYSTKTTVGLEMGTD